MRSLNQFAKVEGHTSLIRDMSSNAIIATDDNEFNAYKKKREIEMKRNSEIAKQQIQIESIRSDVQEIKDMLNAILNAKGIV